MWLWLFWGSVCDCRRLALGKNLVTMKETWSSLWSVLSLRPLPKVRIYWHVWAYLICPQDKLTISRPHANTHIYTDTYASYTLDRFAAGSWGGGYSRHQRANRISVEWSGEVAAGHGLRGVLDSKIERKFHSKQFHLASAVCSGTKSKTAFTIWTALSCLQHMQEWEYEFGKKMADDHGHVSLVQWTDVCDREAYDASSEEIVWKPMDPAYEHWVFVVCV